MVTRCLVVMIELMSASLTREGRPVLSPMNMRLAAGQHLAVLGPNGAGKSSLLRLLSGDEACTGGWVSVFGDNPARMSLREKALRIAMLGQKPDLRFPFKVEEIVALGRYPFAESLGRTNSIVLEVIKSLELDLLIGRSILSLSGGEQQRVHLAKTLVQVWDLQQPGLLLLDEPFAALDIAHQVSARRLIEEMRSRLPMTVISVVHDLHSATADFDQVLMISKQGQQIGFGSPLEMLTEEQLSRIYGVGVRTLYFEDGQVAGHSANSS